MCRFTLISIVDNFSTARCQVLSMLSLKLLQDTATPPQYFSVKSNNFLEYSVSLASVIPFVV